MLAAQFEEKVLRDLAHDLSVGVREGELEGVERLTLEARSADTSTTFHSVSVLVWTPPPKAEEPTDAR